MAEQFQGDAAMCVGGWQAAQVLNEEKNLAQKKKNVLREETMDSQSLILTSVFLGKNSELGQLQKMYLLRVSHVCNLTIW